VRLVGPPYPLEDLSLPGHVVASTMFMPNGRAGPHLRRTITHCFIFIITPQVVIHYVGPSFGLFSG
jgi:hypothetical protein